MTIILPRPQTDIDILIAKLNPEIWNQWIDGFYETEIDIQLPRFKTECDLKLNDALTTLGMGVAFEPYQADFSKMYTGPQELYIGEVKHKTYIEVNEKGTEAAAVADIEVVVCSAPPPPTIMRIDHPFIFAIRENQSGAILFLGKMVEPTLE